MSEFGRIDTLAATLAALGATASPGDLGIGDDTAVLAWPGGGRLGLLVCADAVVEGVHADLALTGLDDLGWKAVTTNLSDVAAMGGSPLAAVVTVAGPPDVDVATLYGGIGAAAARYGCPVVGGDLVGGPTLVVSVAVVGTVDGPAIRRDGARAGDELWVTGPLGAAAAGLRLLRAGAGPTRPDLVAAHARPEPRLAEGGAARAAGATAMIDVSDGTTADLGHLLDASRVGADLGAVPVADGATLDEALGGGDDYELLITVPPGAPLAEAFAAAGLAPPLRLGSVVADAGRLTLDGRPLDRAGWQHGG